MRKNDSIAPKKATSPRVQKDMPIYPVFRPRAKRLPENTGPIDRARQENEADAPLIRARKPFAGAVLAIL